MYSRSPRLKLRRRSIHWTDSGMRTFLLHLPTEGTGCQRRCHYQSSLTQQTQGQFDLALRHRQPAVSSLARKRMTSRFIRIIDSSEGSPSKARLNDCPYGPPARAMSANRTLTRILSPHIHSLVSLMMLSQKFRQRICMRMIATLSS